MKKKLLQLCFLLLLTQLLQALPKDDAEYTPARIFRHLTKSNGLSSNVVNCIIQDRKGFMWFGTDKGLNRYDGRSFIILKNNPKDTNSLSGNNITSLYEDRKGRIWVGTQNDGLNIYDPVTQKVKRYLHKENNPAGINKGYISQVYEDRAGRFWICLYGGGLELFDEKNEKFIHHTWKENDPHAIACNKVKSIYEISPGNYLVGTFETGNGITDSKARGYINRYDLQSNTFEPLVLDSVKLNPYYRHPASTLQRLVLTIMPDSAGNIWFGTYCGVLRYYSSSHRVACYENNEKDKSSLSFNVVNSICELDGDIYFGTEGGGLSVLDTANETFTNFKNDPLNLNSLSDDNIKNIYKDRDNRIWIATSGGGINILDPVIKDFKLYPNQLLEIESNGRTEITIHALCADSTGVVYIGSYSGLTILDTKNNRVKLLKRNYRRGNTINNCQAYAIYPSVTGNYWVSMNNKLMELNPATYMLTDHNLQARALNSNSQHYRGLYKKNQNLPIVNVIERFDRSLLINYFGNMGLAYQPLNNSFIEPNPLTKSTQVAIDNNGRLWCEGHVGAKVRGVKSIDENWKTTEYLHDDQEAHSLISNEVRSIYCDHENNVWVATNKGIDLLDRKTNHFIHYKIPNLPDSLINAMVEDGDKNMWFLTDEALLRMDGKSKKITSFLANKQLPVHKAESRMIYNKQLDVIYFTANEGLVSFYPKKVNLQTETSPIFITNFKLFSKSLTTDSSVVVKRNYNFRYNQNFITIEFTTINYADAGLNQYAYKLEGLNEEWVNVGDQHEANFTNLKPGTYVFRIRGSNREGIWNQASEPITIIIDTPWWQTILFYISCIAVTIVSIFAYNRYRTNIFRKQTQKLEKTVAERTQQYKEQKEQAEKSEQFRQQFLANMSHEIRTPINAVTGFTHLLLEKDPKPEQLRYLQAISKSSDMLLHIVNDVLDLSKIEAGKLNIESIDMQPASIVEQIKETVLNAASEKGLSLITKIHDNLPETVSGDPFRVSQVLLNLCSNAIKFTEAGQIKIEAKKITDENNKHYICFSVTDTGIGIPPEKMDILFKHFSQVNNSDTRKYGGTGLGLSISKNLAVLMGGDISVNSLEGEGSVFSFTIPLVQANNNSKSKSTSKTERKTDGSILNGLRVLLADDNEYNRILVMETLNLKAVLHFDIATTGKEALALLKQNEYDIILMDVQMPEMSGLEATKILRKEFPAPKNKIPVIAFTAGIHRTELEMCIEAGMDAYITKPFKPAELINLIARLTGRTSNTPITIAKLNAENPGVINQTADAVTDLTYLRNFCEHDEARVQQYIKLYLQSMPSFIEKVTVAIQSGSTETIAHLLHSYKPKWVMMGMSNAGSLTKKIENTANDKKADLFELVKLLLSEAKQSVLELQSKA